MKKYLLFSFALLTMQFCLAQWEDNIRLTNTDDTSSTNYSRGHNIATNGDTVNVVWWDKNVNATLQELLPQVMQAK